MSLRTFIEMTRPRSVCDLSFLRRLRSSVCLRRSADRDLPLPALYRALPRHRSSTRPTPVQHHSSSFCGFFGDSVSRLLSPLNPLPSGSQISASSLGWSMFSQCAAYLVNSFNTETLVFQFREVFLNEFIEIPLLLHTVFPVLFFWDFYYLDGDLLY